MFFVPCDNWKTSLSIKFYRYFFFFNRHVVAFLFWKETVWNTYVTATIAVQYLCKSFKIQICNGTVLYFFNFVSKCSYLIAYPKLVPFATLLFLQMKLFYQWKKLRTSWEKCFLHTVLVFLRVVLREQNHTFEKWLYQLKL